MTSALELEQYVFNMLSVLFYIILSWLKISLVSSLKLNIFLKKFYLMVFSEHCFQ